MHERHILGGLGATQYGRLDTALGEIGGETQFSTWAAGLKIFPGRDSGIRLEGRWTPGSIKTDPRATGANPDGHLSLHRFSKALGGPR